MPHYSHSRETGYARPQEEVFVPPAPPELDMYGNRLPRQVYQEHPAPFDYPIIKGHHDLQMAEMPYFQEDYIRLPPRTQMTYDYGSQHVVYQERRRRSHSRGREHQRVPEYYEGSPRITHQQPHRSKSASRSHSFESSQQGRESHQKEYRSPLHQWSAMRTQINEGLAESIVKNRYKDIPVIEQDFVDLIKPPRKNSHGVYHYSTTVDQGTTLQREEYVNFGIPRATIKKSRDETTQSETSSEESDAEKPFYSIDKLSRNKIENRRRQTEPIYGGKPNAENGYAATHMSRGRRLKMYAAE